ncbi:MAG: heparan-alpha-glucosaminide N-acetyltransferase domain-containing protein [Elusimicrobia bacterium]|nr:heparan-alpha-glucosaminide N-acetyltransferase domain-containing protein [Elusimicrobiota bacterium]
MDRQTSPAPAQPGRLLSLDAFRGATIAAMFLVNNAGDWDHVFPPLAHADWNGCTAADLIFPFFLFIMGVAMTYSFGKRAQDGPPIAPIIRRTLLLSALNALLALFAWGAFLGHFRFYGVLQRIAFCYLCTSIIVLRTEALGQALWAAGLLAAYALILRLGSLERFANVVDRVDSKLMLPWLYEIDRKTGLGHDPEGLLSTLGALATTLSGVLCGQLLRKPGRSAARKLGSLALAGSLLLAAGLLWARGLPLNKNLWTPSYVLATSGWAFLGLALFYWLIDIRGIRAWAQPFIVYGSNAIAAYVGVGLMSYSVVWIRWTDGPGHAIRLKTYLYQSLYQSWIPHWLGDRVSSAAWGASYVALWWFLMWLLYRKRIFIKV